MYMWAHKCVQVTYILALDFFQNSTLSNGYGSDHNDVW